MMDASHRLWPVVVATAAPFGWTASLPTRARGPFTYARGAKSCLVLRRVSGVEGGSISSGGGTAATVDEGGRMQAELRTYAQHLRSHTPTSSSALRMARAVPVSHMAQETQKKD